MYRNSQSDFTNWQVLLLVRREPGLCMQEYVDLARDSMIGSWDWSKIKNAANRLEHKGRIYSSEEGHCRRLFPN